MIKFLVSALTLISTLFILTADPALADKRVALVIGNSQYKNTNLVLTNPKNDAEDIAATLRSLGFDVVLATDTDKRALDGAMQQFARKVTDADAALFFYAGHAMQYQGRNYLMPTDAELEDDISLRYQMISVDDVRTALDRTNGVKIMILDACRNNPLADRLARNMANLNRAIGNVRGLARVDKTQGMLVSYATAADDVAQDGSGRNSPFTTALLKRMQEPGVEVEIMFRRVAADVNTQTSGRQRPETYISLLSEYYLNQNDRVAWEKIQDSPSAAALRDFVSKYPSSPYSSQVQTRLAALERTDRDQQANREQAQRESDEMRNRLANLERERADRERTDRERTDRERADRERADRERADRDQAERARLARVEADRQAAEQLARVEAQRRADEACKRDEARLTSLQLTGANAREELVRFERDLGCERLRPLVLAAIAGQAQESKPRTLPMLAALPPTDTPALVRAAQNELRRIGCFAGENDGKFTDKTRDAVRRYLTQRGQSLDDIKISEALVADLKTQDKGVCPLDCRRGQVEKSGRCVAEEAPPRRVKQAKPERRERAVARAPRQPTINGAPINQSEPNRPVVVQPTIGIGGFGPRFGIRLGH
jgi:uncharacterized caspase-like protein